MYDAVLISTHYNYDNKGRIVPTPGGDDFHDLSHVIPLGLIHIAQYLHECGFSVRLVHLPHQIYSLRRFGFKEDDEETCLEKILGRYPARVCGIQAHWHLYCGGAVFISDLYKKIFPDSRIFLGGYMASALWKEFLNISESVDGVILGEGEKAFRNIIEKILCSRGDAWKQVSALACRGENKEFIYNPPSVDSLLALDELPVIVPGAPPFEGIVWPRGHYINISRGLCPENCSYCVTNNKRLNTRSYESMKIDRVLEQIKIYQEHGFSHLFLGEHHFLNIAFMNELFQAMIGENFSLFFELETHPVIFKQKKLLEKMVQANFWRFTMGCESGSDSLLKRMGRRSNREQMIQSVKQIADCGGIVLTSWISNLPGETASEFQETQNLMQHIVELGGFIYWIENLHVSPGSQLYENPGYWNIEILLNTLEHWIDWSINSKKYVEYEEAQKHPMSYLTHLNHDMAPGEMIERFYSNRRLALSFIPAMKHNLLHRFKNAHAKNLQIEMQALDWYESRGWKLWLF
jgi:radical SAM superfamily enzyme YgiQ (UPF0313 family)